MWPETAGAPRPQETDIASESGLAPASVPSHPNTAITLCQRLSPDQDGARTLTGELEQGQHSTGPTLGLGGRVHQHAQGCARQQPRVLVQGLDSQGGKCTTQKTT